MQNIDGSPSHKNKNPSDPPPRRVLRELNARTGWDWTQKDSDWRNNIEQNFDPAGLWFIRYPSGREVVIAVDVGPLIRPFSPSASMLREFYSGPTFIDLRNGSGGNNITPVLPSPKPGIPIPIPVPIPFPIPAISFGRR